MAANVSSQRQVRQLGPRADEREDFDGSCAMTSGPSWRLVKVRRQPRLLIDPLQERQGPKEGDHPKPSGALHTSTG